MVEILSIERDTIVYGISVCRREYLRLSISDSCQRVLCSPVRLCSYFDNTIPTIKCEKRSEFVIYREDEDDTSVLR